MPGGPTCHSPGPNDHYGRSSIVPNGAAKGSTSTARQLSSVRAVGRAHCFSAVNGWTNSSNITASDRAWPLSHEFANGRHRPLDQTPQTRSRGRRPNGKPYAVNNPRHSVVALRTSDAIGRSVPSRPWECCPSIRPAPQLTPAYPSNSHQVAFWRMCADRYT
jgi:hypothetical protein